MSEKRTKKKTIKSNKKTSVNRKFITLRLDNSVEIPAKTAHKKDDEFFKLNDIGFDKIRVSDKKLYSKEHNSYKYYVFYEYDDKYIPLRIVVKEVAGCYNDYKDNGKYNGKCNVRKMNFKLDDNSLDKIIDTFDHVGKK